MRPPWGQRERLRWKGRDKQKETLLRDDHCPAIALAMEPRHSGHTGDTGLRDETGLQQCERVS